MSVGRASSVMLLWAHTKTHATDRCILSQLCALHTCSSSSSLGGSSLLICLSPLRFLGAGSRWSVGRLVIFMEQALQKRQQALRHDLTGLHAPSSIRRYFISILSIKNAPLQVARPINTPHSLHKLVTMKTLRS